MLPKIACAIRMGRTLIGASNKTNIVANHYTKSKHECKIIRHRERLNTSLAKMKCIENGV
jgi:hypothetical protein